MSKVRLLVLACVGLLAVSAPARSEQATFKVKHWFRADPSSTRLWWLVERGGDLVLDDSAKTVSVKSKEGLDTTFDAIERVIFEKTSHMRGGGWGDLLGIGGMAIENKTVADYWCYIEYRSGGGSQSYVVEIPKESAAAAQEKMKAMLGAKVITPSFDERPESIKADSLKDMKSKQDFKSDSKTHPLPEIKSDKALIVMVNPMIDDPISQGPLIRLHANDKVVAVNGWGTYTFFYLDPGDYVLAAQSKDAVSALKMKLEAGKDYYLLEDMVKDGALLTRHSKELVMYQMSGARWADWKNK